MALSLKFNCDRTREVVGTDLSLSPDALLNFPKSDDHTLRDLKQLLSRLAFFLATKIPSMEKRKDNGQFRNV